LIDFIREYWFPVLMGVCIGLLYLGKVRHDDEEDGVL
jgi:hypothetical protein